MRITGGKARGIQLKIGKGEGLRPAMDSIREAVFSSIGHNVIDAKFLDLFAGSGGYGLEAWSRGAQSGTFVEKDRKLIGILKENINNVARSCNQDPTLCTTQCTDSFKFITTPNAFDLIFLDPPYNLWNNHSSKLTHPLPSILNKTPSARLIIESPGIPLPIKGMNLIKQIGKGGKGKPQVNIYAWE